MLQQCTIYACANGTLGLNLSRAPWDPYPWVSDVQAESRAQLGGVCIGDTLIELNGCNVLGLRISELATRLREHLQSGAESVTMTMWRQQANSGPTEDAAEAAHAVQHGINQQSLQKFATCLQHIAQLLECPVCLEVIKPPGWQCCNGHVLCNNCRSRSVKCPVCRVPLGPRGRCLLSDKLFTLLADNFPCDGVKTNKVSGLAALGDSGANKCTNEYHNQPKMALSKSSLSKQAIQMPKKSHKITRRTEEQLERLEPREQSRIVDEKVKSSVQIPKGNEQNNVNNNSSSNSCQDGLQCGKIKLQQQQQQQDELRRQQSCPEKILNSDTQPRTQSGVGAGTGAGVEGGDGNNMLVKPKLKLSKKSWQITGQDQDELRCDEVANINNGQRQSLGPESRSGRGRGQQEYQNYHCPTGKSCSRAKLATPGVALAPANKLSTVEQAAAAATKIASTEGAKKGGGGGGDDQRPALASYGPSDEWQLLRHLSAEHRLAVLHFYGTCGQRMHVQVTPRQTLACLSVSESETDDGVAYEPVKVHKFFLAVIAINDDEDGAGKHAIFLWHLNAETEPAHFEIVLESQCKRVKWFGPSQPLTRSWPEIRAAGEFLTWQLNDEGRDACATFDIIVKRK